MKYVIVSDEYNNVNVNNNELTTDDDTDRSIIG